MKKLMLWLLIATLALSMIGCSSNEENVSSGEDGKYTIGYDIYFLGNSWSVQMYKEFQAEVAKHSDEIEEVIYVDSEGNPEKQVSNLQDLISKNVDVIITTPNNTTAMIPTLEEAQEKGIKVVLVGATLDPSFTDYDLLITVDDTAFGRAGAEWLAEKLEGKGNIVMLNGIAGLATNEQRIAGAKEVFDKYPDIKIIGEANASWDYAKAKMEMSNMLAAYPEIDGVWSQGGAMTLGAIEAFEAAKRDLVPMTGEDNNGLLKVWKERQAQGFDCVAPAKPTWISSEALIQTLKLLKGETVEKDMILDVPMIKGDELDKYVRTDLPDEFWAMTRMNNEEIATMFNETGQN